jgi:hypothetical protein
MANKPDGVITAIRFENGKLSLARIYERRGATYSDHVIITRDTLAERLKAGKKFVTGQRVEYQASTFETGKAVSLLASGVISTDPHASADSIESALLF